MDITNGRGSRTGSERRVMEPVLWTVRLRMIPTPSDILRRAARSGEVAHMLGLDAEPLSRDDRKIRREVYRFKRDLCRRFPSDFLFCTAWQMVLRDSSRLVGEVGFKGPPDESGEMEIGYSTRASFRNQGFMSEAVEVLCRFAFDAASSHLNVIKATTAPDNIASRCVLEKCGFIEVGRVETLILWHRPRTIGPCPSGGGYL